MLAKLLCLLVLTPSLASAGTGLPMNWSPDGHWVAYTVVSPQGPPVLSAGWFFEDAGGGPSPDLHDRQDRARLPDRYRICAADAGTGKAVNLYESAGPLTSPAWRPDGRALAFGRVVNEPDAPARFEVMIQEAPAQNRVVLSQPITERAGLSSEWSAVVPAWSPDGRYLVIPDSNPSSGLQIIDVLDGRSVKGIDGSSPAWSPDGTKLAFFRTERTTSLFVTDVGFGQSDRRTTLPGPVPSFGPPGHVFDLGQTFERPVWSREGRAVLAVARRIVLRGRGPSLQVDLLRVKTGTGSVETVTHLTSDPIEDEKAFLGATLTYDQYGEQLFYSVDVEAQASSIVWFKLRNKETVDRFHPVHFSVRVASLAFSPNAKTLAIRFGEQGNGTVALYDVSNRRFTLLASDDLSRQEWMTLLIATARRLWRGTLPAAAVGGNPIERPTTLPVPGEIPPNQEVSMSLRRLGRLGAPLCELPMSGAGLDLLPGRFVVESRLFFDTLRGDYTAALASLEALEALTSSPDQLERLLAVRAQLFLGNRDLDRAADTIGFLKTLESAPPSRWEDTPAGTFVSVDPTGRPRWARYLAARLGDMRKANPAQGGPEDVPTERAADAEDLIEPVLQRLPFERPPEGKFVFPRPMPAPARVGENPDPGFKRLRQGRLPGSSPTRPVRPQFPR